MNILEKNLEFDYSEQKLEDLPCNYCEGNDFKVLSGRDRYGLNVSTVICKGCGLVFINPRMTAKGYGDFYENFYREQSKKYKNRENTRDLERGFLKQKKFGNQLAAEFGLHLKPGLLIEVGSSAGGVLAGFREKDQRLAVLGIEPSSAEAAFAESQGIPTRVGLFENFRDELLKADNIIIVRSLNHLLDPKKFFTWSWHQLKEGGRLILVVVNFPKACRLRGKLMTQVDHTFMFSPATLKNFVNSAGFEILSSDTESNPDYIKLVARKIAQTPYMNLQFNNEDYFRTLQIINPVSLFAIKMLRKIWR